MGQGETFELRGRKVVKGKAAGPALVTQERISFMGGVDPATGLVSEKGHQIEGQCMAGCVLVYPTGKGSTGGSNRLYDMVSRGTGPVALINVKAEAVSTIGAIMAEIPVVDRLNQDPTQVIKTGDWVEVDADNGLVRITRGK